MTTATTIYPESDQDADNVGKDANRRRGRPPKADPIAKAVLYAEVDASLKQEMERLAKLHNRKLTGELVQAIQEYIARQPPPTSPTDDD